VAQVNKLGQHPKRQAKEEGKVVWAHSRMPQEDISHPSQDKATHGAQQMKVFKEVKKARHNTKNSAAVLPIPQLGEAAD
jgi:hypothetical protein